MMSMTLLVNGQLRQLSANATVAALVADLGCGTTGVAVAVNAEVVPKSCWETTQLYERDRVEVLTATQGG
ncbi:MAG: sulfur carrier protein ThiS [Chloroflexota bacterium]